jgi:hypothetical protein
LPAQRGRADWAPVPGHHTLTLEDASGRTLSTVAFEVRGNPAPKCHKADWSSCAADGRAASHL